ncbi:putative serine carboxypeptidase CPVL [Chionoecetes opilio]|uniref:Putative serine carboxypeptidase CPVL n=1 Tax=Chionoecetes opilio TaxID=41210 RepID=A0A8J8W940_CHIOP|nr:putative serine carboxypeptidase CPVL [Chionoecetes opilio]
MHYHHRRRQEGWEEAPIMVWLDGGPGLSSLFSLFFMHGPFTLNADLELLPREHTCVKTLNVIYIDNPVCAGHLSASGFSYTGHIDGIPRDQVHVGSDLYSSLTQLLSMFPEIKDNNLFVAGHSYAALLSFPSPDSWRPTSEFYFITIDQYRSTSSGIVIGSGVVDPESHINYGDMMYVLGLVDEKEKRYFKAQTELALSLVRRGDLIMAQKVVGSLMGLDMGMSYYERLVGQKNTLNFVVDEDLSVETSYMEGYVSQPYVRRSLHVGNKTFHPIHILGKYFKADVMRSTKPWVEEMLNNSVKVMMYNGQLELSMPYSSHEMLARTLHWGHGEEYLHAPRQAWNVEGQLAGYVREARGLVRVSVRCAGHTGGLQQPHWMFDMFTRFMTRDTFL